LDFWLLVNNKAPFGGNYGPAYRYLEWSKTKKQQKSSQSLKAYFKGWFSLISLLIKE
jgi:hypothetical protein